MDRVIIRKIREAGVVGAGGAGFPTHVKLAATAEIVIANGAECEPLLECDRYTMLRRLDDIIDGLSIAMKAVGAQKGYFAIKEKHHDLVAVLKTRFEALPWGELAVLPDIYPMGDEQVMVFQVTGRVVPPGGIPLAVGCVVSNVTTLANVKQAIDGKPVTRRVVTVNGLFAQPFTREVAIGTRIERLVQAAGGLTRPDAVLIAGGPMTGRPASPDEPVTKTMGALLALPPESLIVREKTMSLESIRLQARSACFQCRDCTRVCPRWQMGSPLQPHLVMRALNYPGPDSEEILKTAHYCCDCGLCSMIACQTMRLSPRKICADLKTRVEKPAAWSGDVKPPDIRLEDQRVPTGRLTMRHLLDQFGHTPWVEEPLVPDSVFIPLRQHIGVGAKPVVSKGDSVVEGDLIASCPARGLGAAVHSSISGTVASLGDEVVTIQR